MSPPLSRRRLRWLFARIGLSRHSALAAARALSTTRPLSIGRQALALVIGSSMIGVAVALLVEARLGLAPYDVLSSAISRQAGVSLGQASWAIAGCLLLVATMLRRPPSLWGVAYILLNGIAIDAAGSILQHPSSLAMRVAFVPAGILVMAAGINVVVHSGTTGGPFELLTAAGEDRGISRQRVRSLLEVGVLLLGLALGGVFGPATVAYGLAMGVTLLALSEAVEDYRFGRVHRRRRSEAADDAGEQAFVDASRLLAETSR